MTSVANELLREGNVYVFFYNGKRRVGVAIENRYDTFLFHDFTAKPNALGERWRQFTVRRMRSVYDVTDKCIITGNLNWTSKNPNVKTFIHNGELYAVNLS